MLRIVLIVIVLALLVSCGSKEQTNLTSTDLERVRNEKTGVVVMYYDGEPFTGTVTDSVPQSNVAKLVTPYKDGRIHGEQLGWYPDGQLEREFNFHEGYPHGHQVMYQPNGQKYIESYFEYGKKNGEFKHWYDNGNLSSVVVFEDDVEVSRIEYAPDGTVRDSL